MADSPGGHGSHDNGGDHSPQSSVREQDRFLPIANIGRIMKKGLPANGKIAKDAKDTVQECVSEFISFVTSEFWLPGSWQPSSGSIRQLGPFTLSVLLHDLASDKCQKEKRKTINGDDLLYAMATLGFEDYIAPLKVYLARYRELEGDSKGSARGADGAGKREIVGNQLGSDTQYAHQGSYAQGFGYSNSQIEY